MTHGVGEMTVQLEGLAETAAGLERLVGRFKLAGAGAEPTPLRARRAA
jgi:hypothetical protein